MCQENIFFQFNSIQFIAKAKATYWKWGCFWGLGGSQKPLRFLQGVSNSLATACNDFRTARAAFTAMAYLGCSKMLKINLNMQGTACELSLVSCRRCCGRRKKIKKGCQCIAMRRQKQRRNAQINVCNASGFKSNIVVSMRTRLLPKHVL